MKEGWLVTDEQQRDPTILFKIENWAVVGEPIPRLALHVHGSPAAFAERQRIMDAFRRLAEDALTGPTLTLDALNDEVSRIASELGLIGYAGECKCRSDPLETVVDASIYEATTPAGR